MSAFPVAGIDQRVVLQQERGRETVFGELCRLPCDGFVEYRFGDLFAARFDIADEVDDVDDAGCLRAGLAGWRMRRCIRSKVRAGVVCRFS